MSLSTEPRAVPALNLKAEYETIREEIEDVLRRVVESQYFINGPEVSGLEQEIAAYCGCTKAVGCASGTDALLLPLLAWGIGPGDEVVTTPYSFFATAGSVWRTGAKPVFVDVEPHSYNIDPTKIEAAITPRTKVIIPVHLYGQVAEMDAICEIASKHGLKVLEDAAQSIGAEYQGLRAGAIGCAGRFRSTLQKTWVDSAMRGWSRPTTQSSLRRSADSAFMAWNRSTTTTKWASIPA